MPIVVGMGPLLGGPKYTGTPSPKGTWAKVWDDFDVPFARDGFARLISAHGTDVLWEKSVPCPKLSPVDKRHHHDFACRVCDGFGRIYIDPQAAPMLIQAIDLHQQYSAQSRVDSGTARVTAMPEFRLSEGDRLTLVTAIDRFEEKVLRSRTSDTDDAKYPIVATIVYDSSPGAFNVSWVDRTGVLKTYVQGVDFQITVSGRIRWLNLAGQPDADSFYSVAYHYHPRYIVIPDLLHQVRMQPVKGRAWEFPVQVMAKYEYLMRDESRDAPVSPVPDPVIRK